MNQNKPKNYITPAGLKKLQDEYNELSLNERPELLKTIAWAAANGDRSENADYIYGRKRLREIDRRLRFLGKRLDAAEVVDPACLESDVVRFGATVMVEDDEGEKKRFIIVGEDEAEPKLDRVSWKSPIGKALLGLSEGDEMMVKTPGGEASYSILSINFIAIE